jgi:hypothetical protein
MWGLEKSEHIAEIDVRPEILDFCGDIDGGGVKDSMEQSYVEKPPLALIPNSLLWAAGRALGHGAAKYAANNWRRGMVWSQPLSALLRHIMKWANGETLDPDSGLSHLDHAAANLAFLTHFEAHEGLYGNLDDRPKMVSS